LTGLFLSSTLEPVRTVRFADSALQRLETEDLPEYSEAIIRAFRLRMHVIRDARDERDFYELKSLRYEKLKGNRSHQHSMRLNKQYRLILEFEGEGADKAVVIVAIEDYH
jgi:proteic killer suppression protein